MVGRANERKAISRQLLIDGLGIKGNSRSLMGLRRVPNVKHSGALVEQPNVGSPELSGVPISKVKLKSSVIGPENTPRPIM
jgi:hypothetical protein